jgi:hypothetical protein
MRHGGSYIVRKPGDEPELVERTQDHPDGNGARQADGTLLPSARDQALGSGAPESPARPARPARADTDTGIQE